MTRAFMNQVDELTQRLAVSAKDIQVMVDDDGLTFHIESGFDLRRLQEHTDGIAQDTQTIEDEVVSIIASHDAYNDDIQALCALLKVSRGLGRVAQTASRIAERVHRLEKRSEPWFGRRLSPTLVRITSLLHEVLRAFGDRSDSTSRELRQRVHDVEKEATEVVRKLMRDAAHAGFNPPAACSELFFLLDDVERMVEQGRSIALALVGRSTPRAERRRAACPVP